MKKTTKKKTASKPRATKATKDLAVKPGKGGMVRGGPGWDAFKPKGY